MFTITTLKFLVLGSFLGLTAGISPGPLLTLVITETLKHSKTEGIKIAISPLITDLPIIIITFFIFLKLSQFNMILGAISFLGGIFVAYLGYESIKTKGLNVTKPYSKSQSFKKGVIANLLNPHPYIFWSTIGTPYIIKAIEINSLTAILFVFSFYVLLIGSKVIVAILVSRSKKFIKQKSYLLIVRLLGIALFLFSLLFFYDGYKYLSLSWITEYCILFTIQYFHTIKIVYFQRYRMELACILIITLGVNVLLARFIIVFRIIRK